MKYVFILLLTVTFSGFVKAAEKELPKGMMSEINSQSKNEDENQIKSMNTEIMITKSENEALAQLQKIIAKRKGSAEEPSLWYRLGELYMRRAKSGRFFDLYRNEQNAVSFVPPVIREQSAAKHLNEAIKIYEKIEKQWPRFEDLDAVLFNSGFALQQVGKRTDAEKQYLKLTRQFPNSPLLPDTELALGEMNYEQHRFQVALEHFQIVEKYPQSRVYAYGMYKSAWALYNLKRNETAIEKLIDVVKYFDPNKPKITKVNHNLRSEAIQDLALIFEDVHTADKAYDFFSKICTEEELSKAMINLGKLYQSHSRHKDLNIFLSEFTKKNPLSNERVRAHLMMVESFETLKERDKVVSQLEELALLCKADSTYRKANDKIAVEHCDFDLAKTNVEIAKKWWDLWLKQKQNKQLANYTLKAFELHLNREDKTKPDVKSRYAYAELNYQLEDYRQASAQYELVSDKAADTAMLHDATYSAIVALEKASEKKLEKTDKDEQLRLLTKYLDRYPAAAHTYQVKFKIGFIQYERQNYTVSDKWLRPLALDKKSGEFKRKSEDLVLDILNAQKNYTGIRSFALDLIKEKPQADRIQALNKLVIESEYALIQESAKNSDRVQTAKKLNQFYLDHRDSTLAKDALWQSLSLYYAAGKVVDGADLSLLYVKSYPKEEKNKDALKEAAKAYSESGLFLQSADTLLLVAEQSDAAEQKTYLEAAAEFYTIEGKLPQARRLLEKMITEKNKADHSRIYAQILQTLKGQETSKEYLALESKLLAQNIEPYASLILVKKVEAELQAGKLAEAFQSAKPIVGGNGSDEAKARARLVQALVLEKEFVSQSTKTSIEKLSVVLSMKTEKLEKAQVAFLAAAKISNHPDVQLQALNGLKRIYQNYVETVSQPTVKTELTDEEKKTLDSELAKLVRPIQDKKTETENRLLALSKESQSLALSDKLNFSILSPSETIKPVVTTFKAELMPIFLPEEYNIDSTQRYVNFELNKKDKCQFIENNFEMLNKCLLLKNTEVAQKILDSVIRQEPKKAAGLFYLSALSFQRKEYQKARYVLELLLKTDSKNPVVHYQNALTLQALNEQSLAHSEFIKSAKLGLRQKELHVIEGLLSYSQGDHLTALTQFNELSQKSLRPFAISAIYAECLAMNGEAEKALSILNKELQENKNQSELYIEMARIHEAFRYDKSEAIKSYELASQYSTDESFKDWSKKKIGYLSQTTKVTALNPQHVSTKDSSPGKQVGGQQ